MFELDIRPSRLALQFLLFVHLWSSLALCLTELPASLLAASLLALGLCGTARVRAELSGSAVRILRARIRQQSWILESRQGERQYQPPAVIFASELLIVLVFKREINAAETGGVCPKVLLICPDSLSGLQSRRLRRYLRFECPEASP